MKKILIFGICFAWILVAIPVVAQPIKNSSTIQGGQIKNTAGETVTMGYDKWGYNYQAHMFNGKYCDAYRDASWCQLYKNDNLSMKWNDAWLSNKDMDENHELDRHYGYPSYRGSGAWLTNHMSGTYLEGWDVTGDWIINVNYLGVDYPESTTFVQTGDSVPGSESLTGTLVYPGSPWTINSGSVVGTSIEFFASYDSNPSITARFWGSIADDGTMSGSWEDTPGIGRSGTWASASGQAVETEQSWSYFTKIVAAPVDASPRDGKWYDSSGTEIGPMIWGDFATIQEVYNDTGTGEHGIQYLSPLGPGFGHIK